MSHEAQTPHLFIFSYGSSIHVRVTVRRVVTNVVLGGVWNANNKEKTKMQREKGDGGGQRFVYFTEFQSWKRQRVRFFGRIQDWIYDLRSQGFPKETKNPRTDFFGVTAHFQPGCMNEICFKLKFCEKFTTFYKFRVHRRRLISRHDSRKWPEGVLSHDYHWSNVVFSDPSPKETHGS